MGRTMSKPCEGRNIYRDLCETLSESFQIGKPKSFDHGKIGSFLLLSKMYHIYKQARDQIDKEYESVNYHHLSGISWHRANLYYDLMDSALAIYLHNTLRFQLADLWGNRKFTPYNIPPLSYLLFVCDNLVEWDKPSVDDQTTLKPDDVEIESIADEETIVKFKKQKPLKNSIKDDFLQVIDEHFIRFKIVS